jgi:hypothetical protein
MPDTSVTLPIPTDVGELPEFKTAATTSGFDDRHLETRYSRPTTNKDDIVIYKSGMVENMGANVEIAAPSLVVQK